MRLDCGGERNGQHGTGGKQGEGKETTGTQAWKITGLKGGRQRRGIAGGSVLHGEPEELTSTRGEAIGVYSACLALEALVKQYQKS